MSVKQLRTQSLFDNYDQLTPGAGQQSEYSDDDYNPNPSSPYTPGPTSSGLEQVGSQQDRDAVLGPDGKPLESNIKAPTIDPVGAPEPKKGASFEDYLGMMNKGYTPDYTSRDRLNKLLDEAPTRSAPGWGRALVAAGMSIKAQDPIATAEKVMYAPYMRDVEEWKTRADPYYKAADLENRQNINERTLMTNAATAYTAAERARITEENNQMRNQVAVTRNNIQQAKNNGLKVTKDGDRFVGHDLNGKQYDLGPSKGMTREEEINALGEWGVKRAEAQGVNQAANAAANPGQQVLIGGQPHRYDPATGEYVPIPVRGGATGTVTRPSSSAGGGSGGGALERGRVEQERYRDAIESNDPAVRRFVIPKGNNTYGLRPRPVPHEDTWAPGDHVPQEDADEWDRVKKIIDPSYVAPPPTIPRVGQKGLGPSGQATTRILNPDGSESTVPQDPRRGEVTPDMPRVPPPGTIRMKTPDGRIVNVPANKVAEAEKRGGRRLQ